MRRVATLLLVLCILIPALSAQTKLSHRASALLVGVERNADLTHSPAKAFVKSVGETKMVDVYVHFNNGVDEALIARHGGRLLSRYDNMRVATALVPVDRLKSLSEESEVRLVELTEQLRPLMDRARTSANVNLAQLGVDPLPQDYYGRGVIVGVVDQEFQTNHINFYSHDRQRFRVKRFWNQNGSGTRPQGYNYGAEYTDSASIIRAKYDVDSYSMTSGHATHVTGIAAGADHSKNYYGVAGEADLALVGTTGESSSLVDGVQYIFNYADQVNKPCVVNISMGSYLSAHDGTSTMCRILDQMIRPGRLLVAAAANSGNSPMHIGQTFSATDTLLKTFVDLQMSDYGYPYSMVDIWGDANLPYDVRFVVYDRTLGQEVYSTPYYAALADSTISVELDTTIRQRSVQIELTVATGRSDDNNKGNVYLEYQAEYLPSRYEFGIVVRAQSGTVNMWTYEDLSLFSAKGRESDGWRDGDGDMTIGAEIGEVKKAITVGSYCSKSYGASSTEDISYFSSRGPLADGTLKPEIAAPGEIIMSSVPDVDNRYIEHDEQTTVGGKTYYYGKMQGTSMACPFVTGVIALWLEANPALSYDDVIDVFAHTSIRDSHTGSALPDNTWGYGKINAFQGLIYILGLNVGVHNPESPSVLSAFPNPTFADFNIVFTEADRDVTVTVYDLSGREVLYETFSRVMPGEQHTFSLSGVDTGVYMVSVRGAKINESLKVIKQ